MKLDIEVKYAIGEKVMVTNKNISRCDYDGPGVVEGYVIRKTKKSCRIYYLVEGRGSFGKSYRYGVNELSPLEEAK